MTTENNKIIAEFMGYKKNTPSKDFFQHPTEKNRYDRIEFLSYDSDWNWLMEVVEKIYNTKAPYELHKNIEDAFIYKVENRIESVYNACVEFIKWYNEENK